uniref:Elongation factor 1-delta n=1 Tax=Aceria tosichella TaxID=561515 RepID=A0A6G1SMV6_9ACAR
MASPLIHENIWFEKPKYEAAERQYYEKLSKMDGIAAMAGSNVELVNRINSLEKENATLHKVVDDLKNLVISLDSRVKSLEGGKPSSVSTAKTPAKAPAKEQDDDDDDGVDLFGSDSEEESEEAAKVREQRLAAYAAKKSKKPALIAKSNIILSVSPWDDETDMKKMEQCVRSIEMDGLVWGASKLVPLAYGIHKLHISCVVEDDKVSVDLLQEKIQDFEDYVQSVDIAAFNKV